MIRGDRACIFALNISQPIYTPMGHVHLNVRNMLATEPAADYHLLNQRP
jgi:hypothetical protein